MAIFIPVWKEDLDFKLALGKFNSFTQQTFILYQRLGQALGSNEE